MNSAYSNASGPEARIVKSAADWRVRHEAGLTAAEQSEFTAWLAESPRHAAAWRDVNSTLLAFEGLRASGQAADFMQQLALRQRRRRWRQVAAGVIGLAAAVAVLIALRPANPSVIQDEPAGRAPVIVRAQQQVLPDGSRVELNAGAEISANYTPARREVRLLRGEALFTVEKNPHRPFVVVSGNLEVRAVGTTFAVHFGHEAVDVLVTEGRVAVAPAMTPAESASSSVTPIFVNAGNQLVLPAETTTVATDQPRAISNAQIGRRLSWVQPRLQLAGTSLAEAVALLNRENLMQIEIAEPELGRLRLTGFFYLDNTRGFVHVLEANYGIQVERRGDGSMVLRGRSE